MAQIGKYNDMRISRFSEYGAYLVDEKEENKKGKGVVSEVLLPARYVTEKMVVGDSLPVFVYTDSEDRPVATTEKPFATVGEFAFLQVEDVNRVGAFLDWGLSGKQLLVPYSQQKVKMRPGGIYPVYVYLDDVTGRVVASAKIDNFLGNVYPDYTPGNKVEVLLYGHNELGYQAIVNNLHKGLIYNSETHRPLELATKMTAYVRQVREDGKIDLTLTAPGTFGRIEKISEKILKGLANNTFKLKDSSTPAEVEEVLECSKKDFKKAVGALYKAQKIIIDRESGEISLPR